MTHDEFIALLAHELRGPIGALGSAAMVLQECDPTSDLAKEAREIVARQSHRLADAVEELQVLGRLMSPQEMRRERVVIAALVRSYCDCEIAPGFEDASVETDRGRFEDALARTAAQAPSRLTARISSDEQKKAAALFTLEPVGGGLGVQLLRVMLESAGAQVAFENSAQGRRLAARLAR
jgi:hypothetical protein